MKVTMKMEIKIPSMGESITQATVGTIFKASGSIVKVDDELLELETEKVNQVLYAPQSGKVNLNVKPQDVVKIGQVIGYIDNESVVSEPEKNPVVDVPKKVEKHDKPITPKPTPEFEQKESARFTKDDFLASLKDPSPQPVKSSQNLKASAHEDKQETRKQMSMIRKVIATRLVEVKQTTAMLTTFNEVDMSQVISLREKYQEAFQKQKGVKLGYMSFFVKASVSALKAMPELNSYIEGNEIVQRHAVDIGIAVAAEKGLFVPVVKGCDQLTFAEIEEAIHHFSEKSRDGKLAIEDLTGGGFTITNGGVFGSLLSTPILNPSQCAILGMHKIEKRAVVVDDQIVIRPMMYLALSYDHRIIDGKEAVQFLVHIKNCLEDPARLALNI